MAAFSSLPLHFPTDHFETRKVLGLMIQTSMQAAAMVEPDSPGQTDCYCMLYPAYALRLKLEHA